jgi:class 3 adenylate cyclase/ActR/RegA family two-component response regulator
MIMMMAAPMVTGSRGAGARKRILVVDDSLIMRNLITEIVDSDPDLEVVDTAPDGRSALQKVRQLKPDAVLLDIEMPEMSGLETLRRLNLRSTCKVVILSSLVVGEDSAKRVEALRLGAVATIGKPSGGVSFDLKQKRASEIVRTLRRALDLPTLGEPTSPPAEAETPERPAPAGFADDLLAGLETGVLLFDHSGLLMRANPAAGRILRGCDIAPGQATIGSVCGEFNQPLGDEIWDVIGGGESRLPDETDFAAPDGGWIPVRRTIRPTGRPSEPRGALVLLDDITDARRMRALLDKTMSPGVARNWLAAPDEHLGGELRDATILFADVRGFTSLAETLGAYAVVDFLNRYFAYMADVISAEGGTIDKFIGDGIMALFGIPTSHGDDADRAVGAARNMLRALALLNDQPGFPTLKIGIGIATGPVIAGRIGSPDRMNHTVIGNAANFAARIEGACKTYGCPILVSDETMKRLRRPVTSRMVDVVAVEGQETQTPIHEIFVEAPDDAEQWLELFSAGVAAYLAGDFATAQHHFANVGMINPDDPVTRVLAERCRQLDRKPPSDWTGAWKLREK